jgi:hypothetical protein
MLLLESMQFLCNISKDVGPMAREFKVLFLIEFGYFKGLLELRVFLFEILGVLCFYIRDISYIVCLYRKTYHSALKLQLQSIRHC